VTAIHADIEALTELRAALTRFRYAQREVAERGGDAIEATRASLEAKASRWRARLEQGRAELAACQDRAAAAADAPVDCAGYARAISEAGQRLQHVREWQQRIDQQVAEFAGTADRFKNLLETDLPRAEEQLAAIIASLRAARRVPPPGP
jgi:chromosome segregation ATPase